MRSEAVDKLVLRTKIFYAKGSYEDRLIKKTMTISVMFHLMFMLLNPAMFWWKGKPLIDEWTIEAEVALPFDLMPANKTAIPDSKPEEQPEVPSNLLPQLPKKFAIKESEPFEDDGDTVPDEQAKDEKKEAEQEKNPPVKADPEEANKLAMQEALKRLALEKLRDESKDKKDLKSPEKDMWTKVKEDLNGLNGSIGSSGGDGSNGNSDQYRNQLRLAIRRNYHLPDAYNLKNAELQVVIAIEVNAKGDLINSKIEKASGDQVFDELALNALRNSAPLPEPPKEQLGQTIYLQFSPKTF